VTPVAIKEVLVMAGQFVTSSAQLVIVSTLVLNRVTVLGTEGALETAGVVSAGEVSKAAEDAGLEGEGSSAADETTPEEIPEETAGAVSTGEDSWAVVFWTGKVSCAEEAGLEPVGTWTAVETTPE
jgi:hypothetical protein